MRLQCRASPFIIPTEKMVRFACWLRSEAEPTKLLKERTVYYEKPITGIYKITHQPTGRAYIGLSVDIFKRFKEHTNFAQAKKKWQAIKKAIYEHGITEFTFEVIEVCPEAHLAEREVHWISFYDTCSENGFNKNRGKKVDKSDDHILNVIAAVEC